LIRVARAMTAGEESLWRTPKEIGASTEQENTQ